MPDPFLFPLKEVQENGEMAVKADAPADAFPGALTEGALVGPVTVEGVIRRVDDDAVFSGRVSGRWRFECSRCLAPVDGTWSEEFESSAPVDAAALDLAEDARQSIGLAQPMKIFCRPDCKGLCPVCRANLNAGDCGHKAPASADDPATTRPRLTPRRKKG